MGIVKQQIVSNKAPAPAGPYSQALIVDKFIFLAGQRPQDPVTGLVSDDVSEQTRQCIKNVEALLIEAGSSLANIVRSNVYLSDIKYFDEMNSVYSRMIPEPYPTRTTVGVQLRNIKVELEVIALRGNGE